MIESGLTVYLNNMSILYAVDVETTGLDAHTSSIVSIGIVNMKTRETFYKECRSWDGAEVHDGALKVNGFTREYLAGLPLSEAELIAKMLEFVHTDALMLAHNSAFDKSFVEAACARAGVKSPFSFRTVDLHSIVYAHMTIHRHKVPFRLSLNECLKYAGKEKEPDPHNALTGALCNATVYDFIVL